VKRALLLLGLCSCASYASVAQTYADKGNYELAALYWRAAHLESPQDPALKSNWDACVQSGQKSLDHDLDAFTQQQDYVRALGVAWRRVSLTQHAETQVNRSIWLAQQQGLEKQALAAAVRRVDSVETSGGSPTDLLDALRVARAWNPDDGELARRYQRAQDRLALNVVITPHCNDAQCAAFVSSLANEILKANSELVRLVPAGSEIQNATLEVDVNTLFNDGPWVNTAGGKSNGQVERRNRFNEIEYDANQHPLMMPISADYRTFERTNRATMAANVVVHDVTPAQKVLFQTRPSQTETDTRRYVDWQGDERALGPLMSLGTNQEPPADSRTLATRLVGELAKQVVQDMLHQLDGK